MTHRPLVSLGVTMLRTRRQASLIEQVQAAMRHLDDRQRRDARDRTPDVAAPPDDRRARPPAPPGAAHATTRAVPELAGRFDGVAVRATRNQ